MSDYLDSVARRLAEQAPIELAWELEQAFSEALSADPASATPRVHELHELLRFCKFDAIAPWLAHERDAVARALAFAERSGALELSAILRDALAGKTQGEASFTVTLPNGQYQLLEVEGGALTRYDGQDWGGTDIALSFVVDDFTLAVVREVVAARDEFALDAPAAERRKAAARHAAGSRAQRASAADLFAALVAAGAPRMEVGDWQAFEARRVGGNQLIALSHDANPPAAAERLAAMAEEFGAASRELLSLYARHDGAALFQHGDTCGFYFATIDEWQALRQRAIDWARNVSWQDDPDEIPPYLYDAIAFGLIPGDSEVWLLLTSGEHAGKIMLSDTDLLEESPRFESVGDFMATLLEDAASVLNCGGQVRYRVAGEECFAVRYLHSEA